MNELISTRKPLYTITSGDIEAADLPTGIDAAKIADGSVSNTEFQYVNGVTSAIQTQLTARLPLAGGTMTGAIVLHADPGSAMHAATKQYVDAAAGTTYTADETTLTLSGTVFSIKTSGVANTQISASAAIDLSKLATVTASRALVSTAGGVVSASSVTSTELGYVSGVTSAIQTQLNAKQATITGAATSIVSSNLTVSSALVSDGSGKVAVSAVTATELGYVSGVTSAIQTQLNTKQATITGGATTIATSNLTASRALVSDGSGKVAVSAVTATELTALSGVSGTLVSTAATQTLTNKTLTSPAIGSQINDTNGNELIKFLVATGAVNEVTIGNHATTGNPYIQATGNDTDINLSLSGKGSGSVSCGSNLAINNYAIVDGNNNEYLKFSSTATAVNEITVTNAAAGGAVKLEATGGSTNIDLHIGAKGTGVVYVSSGDLWTSGYVKHKSTYGDKNTATDGATVTFNLALSNDHYVLIQGNRTFAVSNSVVGQWFNVMVQQDGIGSRTVTWWSGINWAGGVAPTLTTTANRVDILRFYCFSSGVYMGTVLGQNIAN